MLCYQLENVLLTTSGEFKLCDFGSCTTRAQVYSTKEEIAHEEERVGKFTTAMYRAPEMVDLFSKAFVNEKVDVWALGCILFTIAFFEHPFQTAGNLGIINGKYDVPDDNRFSKYLTVLIRKLLTTESVPHAMQSHPFCAVLNRKRVVCAYQSEETAEYSSHVGAGRRVAAVSDERQTAIRYDRSVPPNQNR